MASNLRDFHLTILDQTMLRMYVRHLIIFPFPEPQYSEDAIRTLRAGFSATIHQFPFLAGTVSPSSVRMGGLSLQYPDPITEELIDQIFTASFDMAENWEYEYKDMEKAGFPPSRLPRDVFCPTLLRNHPGLDDAFAEGLISFKNSLPVPVLAAQITFVPGALVLSMYSNHSVVDGSGIANIYQVWSAYVRAQTQAETPGLPLVSATPVNYNQDHFTSLDSQRRSFDHLAELTEPVHCPEVRYPGTPPSAPKLRRAPYNLAARILRFSASTISDLASTLSSITNLRISSFTALVSLLWTTTTRARSSSLTGKDIQTTKLSIAFDHRKSLDQEFTESYLGNCATGITASCPLSAMLSQASSPVDAEHLAPIALNITQTVSSITLDWLKSRLSLFSRTPNSHQLSIDVDIPNGPDLFVTSWMHIGADSAWNIPGTKGKAPSAIRKPKSMVEGNIHILPRSRVGNGDRSFEVLLCLEEGEIGRVVERLESEGWVERVIEA